MSIPKIHIRPSSWRDKGRFSFGRIVNWTIPRRIHEGLAVLGQKSLVPAFESARAKVEKDAGKKIEHTAVSQGQQSVLLAAIAASEEMGEPIIEIGSFRGITTRAIALATKREVVAVDPYIGEGGHQVDLDYFREHTAGLQNVTLLRNASDPAFREWGERPISFVFIDAIHEYLHAWFDFTAWGSLVKPGGFVAFHDVDQFAGVNRACQKLLRECPEWQPWGYAPNIGVFRRVE